MKQLKLYLLLALFSLPWLSKANSARHGHLLLQTDKSLYVSGENIRFKCTQVQLTSESQNVLYVDICGEGYHIASRILKPANSHWNGSISLPDTLQSGVYLMRAYVGNVEGEATVVSMPLAVVNRFGNNELNKQRQAKRDYVPLVPGFNPEQDKSKLLLITTPETSVKPGKSIDLKVENQLKQTIGGISLVVFKTPGCSEFQVGATKAYDIFMPSERVKIFPQLMISGKVSKENQAVEGSTVLLSVPDSIAGINYATTDSLGEFRFNIKQLYGETDFVVQTIDKQNNYQLTLYPGLLLPPAEIPFYLPADTEQSEFVQLAVQRASINMAYTQTMAITSSPQKHKLPFYGISNNRVLPERYVPLDDFREIALEILPTVRYTLNRDSSGIRLWDPVTKGFYYNPWILVDGVPLFNAASLNVLNSEKIKWIEIQPQVRCYGNLLIEGLLNIQTQNGDFSDVVFPENALRKKMDTFYDFRLDQHVPDKLFNDVLLWEPILNMNDQSIGILVKTTMETGSYTALVQTIDHLGNLHQHFCQFKVEP